MELAVAPLTGGAEKTTISQMKLLVHYLEQLKKLVRKKEYTFKDDFIAEVDETLEEVKRTKKKMEAPALQLSQTSHTSRIYINDEIRNMIDALGEGSTAPSSKTSIEGSDSGKIECEYEERGLQYLSDNQVENLLGDYSKLLQCDYAPMPRSLKCRASLTKLFNCVNKWKKIGYNSSSEHNDISVHKSEGVLNIAKKKNEEPHNIARKKSEGTVKPLLTIPEGASDVSAKKRKAALNTEESELEITAARKDDGSSTESNMRSKGTTDNVSVKKSEGYIISSNVCATKSREQQFQIACQGTSEIVKLATDFDSFANIIMAIRDKKDLSTLSAVDRAWLNNLMNCAEMEQQELEVDEFDFAELLNLIEANLKENAINGSTENEYAHAQDITIIPVQRPKLKKMTSRNYSFSLERTHEINRHNKILLKKILSQKSKYSTPGSYRNMVGMSPSKTSVNAMNRQQRQHKIYIENQALKQKIKSIFAREPQY